MRVHGLKTIRHITNWLHSRVTNFVLVLGYHRVAQTEFDPYELCIRPNHFAEHLDVLRCKTDVIDIKTLQQGLVSNSLPRRAVLITFDDAYQDILHIVKPLLSSHNLPAITFAATGSLGQEYWWDHLTRLVFSPAVLPDNLNIQIGSETITWSALSSNHLAPGKETLDARQRLLQQLYQQLVTLPNERPSVLAQLLRWAETAETIATATARAMTAAELQTLAQDGLVSVGSHTVTHPLLTSIPQDQQYNELRESKQTLENILSQPVTALSYPHGVYNAKTQKLAEETGYQLACSSQNGIVHQGHNRFALPRFWVPDWDGEQFDRWLARWF
jgi:peptidoglycan/xylan/chitin deacetylase (PgdA/CDA1 family)